MDSKQYETIDLYQTSGSSPPEGIALTMQDESLTLAGVTGSDDPITLPARGADDLELERLAAQPPRVTVDVGDILPATLAQAPSPGPCTDPVPPASESPSLGRLPSNGERTPTLVTWVEQVVDSEDYRALRDKLVTAKWWKHRRFWHRLALTQDDLTSLVDEHVLRVLGRHDAPPKNVVNFVGVVIDRKLRDERRKGKRRIEAEQYVEDGQTDEKGGELRPTPVGVAFDLDSGMAAKAILASLTRRECDGREVRPGAAEAVLQAMGLLLDPGPAARKRISRFYAALADDLNLTTEQARSWVDVQVRTMLATT